MPKHLDHGAVVMNAATGVPRQGTNNAMLNQFSKAPNGTAQRPSTKTAGNGTRKSQPSPRMRNMRSTPKAGAKGSLASREHAAELRPSLKRNCGEQVPNRDGVWPDGLGRIRAK